MINSIIIPQILASLTGGSLVEKPEFTQDTIRAVLEKDALKLEVVCTQGEFQVIYTPRMPPKGSRSNSEVAVVRFSGSSVGRSGINQQWSLSGDERQSLLQKDSVSVFEIMYVMSRSTWVQLHGRTGSNGEESATFVLTPVFKQELKQVETACGMK